MKLLVVTLRPLNTRKFAKNATFHSSKFLKLKLSSHAIILCNFFLLNYTIFNCIKVICPRFSHILQFSVFLVLSVYIEIASAQSAFFQNLPTRVPTRVLTNHEWNSRNCPSRSTNQRPSLMPSLSLFLSDWPSVIHLAVDWSRHFGPSC